MSTGPVKLPAVSSFFLHNVPDPRFPDDGKVELLLSESPEKITGRRTLFFFVFKNEACRYSELDNTTERKYAGENVL